MAQAAEAALSRAEVAEHFCAWLRHEASAGGLDAEAAESVGIVLDLLPGAFGLDASSSPASTVAGADIPGALALGLRGRDTVAAALKQLQAAQAAAAAPAAAAAAAAEPEPVNALEGKFAAYLRVIAARGFFGTAEPGDAEYEERYKRARAVFIGKQKAGSEAGGEAAAAAEDAVAAGGGDDDAAAAAAAAPAPATAAAAHRSDDAEVAAMAEGKKGEGNKALMAGEYEVAIERYTEAIELDDTNAIYFANRAAAYSHLKQHERAVSDCEQAIRCDPKYVKGYSRLGLAHFSLGNYKDAVTAYEKVMELEPSNTQVPASLAKAKALAGDSSVDASPATTAPPAGGMPDLAAMMGAMGGGGAGGAGGMPPGGLAGLMSDPNFATMAQQAMSNPQVQAMMRDPNAMAQAMQAMQGMGLGGMPPGGAPPQ